MSHQETTLFECPCIGDDLNARDRSGQPRFMLERLRAVVDACSNPPQFRGVKTPVTESLDQETTKHNPKDPRDKKNEDNKRKLNSRAGEKTDKSKDKTKTTTPAKRPDHELPSSFPPGLKRPNLTATVEGKTIASEFQRQLFDDIRHGNCVRCHSKDHARATCKQPAGKWEEKFDKDKSTYWAGALKWQQKAQAEKATAKT